MPNATLGSNLLDSLVPVVDSIRDECASILGTRQYKVEVIQRRWSGGRRGSGTKSFVSEVELTPKPLLAKFDVDGRLQPCGLDEEGEIVLVEVSLTFKEEELYLPTLPEGDEFYYRVSDCHGQCIETRYFTPSGPPYTIRSADSSGSTGLATVVRNHPLCWVVRLRRIEISDE